MTTEKNFNSNSESIDFFMVSYKNILRFDLMQKLFKVLPTSSISIRTYELLFEACGDNNR